MMMSLEDKKDIIKNQIAQGSTNDNLGQAHRKLSIPALCGE